MDVCPTQVGIASKAIDEKPLVAIILPWRIGAEYLANGVLLGATQTRTRIVVSAMNVQACLGYLGFVANDVPARRA